MTFKFRKPRSNKLVGARVNIRHRDIVKAIIRLSEREDFHSCSPMDVWRECLKAQKINFEGDYYGQGNTPKPSRSQATMMSIRLSATKNKMLDGRNSIAAATKFLELAKSEKAALDLIERAAEFIKLAGNKERAKMAIKIVAEVKKASGK